MMNHISTLKSMGASRRLLNCLRRMPIRNLEELIDLWNNRGQFFFMTHRGFGDKCAYELKKLLEKLEVNFPIGDGSITVAPRSSYLLDQALRNLAGDRKLNDPDRFVKEARHELARFMSRYEEWNRN